MSFNVHFVTCDLYIIFIILFSYYLPIIQKQTHQLFIEFLLAYPNIYIVI